MTAYAPIGYIADWQTRLRSRIYEQFSGLPNLQGVCDAFAAEVQQLEDAAQTLLSIASIDDSTGQQLQVLARLLGQPSDGVDEPTFRLYLKARVRADESSGTPQDLYDVFAAAFALTGTGHAQIVPYATENAEVEFRVLDQYLDGSAATAGFDLLVEAKAAGVRLVFEWPPSADVLPLMDDTVVLHAGDTFIGWGDTNGKFTGGVWGGAWSS